MAPRKVRFVADSVRSKTVEQALAQLSAVPRRAATPLSKAIASAFANAKLQHPELKPDELVISKLLADEGPRWKRFRAVAFGRAAQILKRSTHITVELDRRNK